MKKKAKTYLAKFIYLLLAIIGGICAWILFRTSPVPVHPVTVQRGPFEETFYIDGTVRSRSKFTIAAFATGDLERMNLKVGDPVKKGQRLTILNWDFQRDVLSPIDGVVSKVYRESAGPVNRGDPIVDIIDPSNLEILVEVLTSDAIRIKEGTAATIHGWGQGLSLPAKVRRISRAGFVKLSALGIEEEKTNVYLHFLTPPPPGIGDSFHVEVRFVLSKDENVLTIPAGALFRNEESWAVYKIKDKRAQLRNINITKKSDTQAVVSNGLDEGDVIINFPNDLVSDGTKVKAVMPQ